MPQEFKDALVISLFKGIGNKKMPANYRGISLLNCAGKVHAHIFFNRLHNEVLESIIPEEQCGLRSERSTINLIFDARQIQEKCRKRC